MRTTEFRRTFRNAALAAAIALVSAAAPSVVSAQVATDTGAVRTTTDDGEDDGMDLGWIGLLGLAGLAGLRKKDHVVHHTDTTATRRP